jgi:hypothetical protein
VYSYNKDTGLTPFEKQLKFDFEEFVASLESEHVNDPDYAEDMTKTVGKT